VAIKNAFRSGELLAIELIYSPYFRLQGNEND
jgi:hypothetical protein